MTRRTTTSSAATTRLRVDPSTSSKAHQLMRTRILLLSVLMATAVARATAAARTPRNNGCFREVSFVAAAAAFVDDHFCHGNESNLLLPNQRRRRNRSHNVRSKSSTGTSAFAHSQSHTSGIGRSRRFVNMPISSSSSTIPIKMQSNFLLRPQSVSLFPYRNTKAVVGNTVALFSSSS